MILNICLVFIILAEILGFSQAQEKFLFSKDQELIKEVKVLGEKSLPQIELKEINPLPVDDSSKSVETKAKSAAILDLKTNKILFQKNANESLPVASITKLMSAVALIENFDLDQTVTVPYKSAYPIGSKMHLYPGEQIKAAELVQGMLIASANDAAKALEEHFGKEAIVEKMNLKAEFLGLADTHFVEVSGLDPENKSSVSDLIILSRYALKNPQIVQAIQTKEYTALSVDGTLQHQIHTTNRLLKNDPDIFGIKTGYTEEAGSCLIAGAVRGDHEIISVILGMDDYNQRFSESRALIDWAFANFNW